MSDPRGGGPLVRPEDVALLGVRSGWTSDAVMTDLLANRIGVALALVDVRRYGAVAAADRALAVLAKRDLAGFWLHLDADVLDNKLMPAVDSPQPGGLSYGELIAMLRRLLASRRVVGITISSYDPDLDPDGTIAAAFVAALGQGLGDEPVGA